MMEPSGVQILAFDFDGTLRDSMNPEFPGTKPDAFSEGVLDYHPGARGRKKEIIDIYCETSGMNRVKQLRIAEERLGLTPIPVEEESAWSDAFNSHIKDGEYPLFPGVIETVSLLKSGYRKFVVASSIPQDTLETGLAHYPELNDMVDLVLGNQRWDKAPGAEANFTKGVPYGAFLCGRYDVQPHQIAYIGDAVEDIFLGNQAGGFTVAFPDTRLADKWAKLEKAKPDAMIRQFSDLLDVFK